MGGRKIAKVGYARVSTKDQNLDMQIDELKKDGCERVYTDKVTGAKSSRPGLDKCLKSLKEGDTLVVWRLDRLGRSMIHLVSVVNELKEKNIGFKSLRDGAINTSTPSGELVFNIFSALAQFERELIRERVMAGLTAARARGKKGGRPAVLHNSPKVQAVMKMHGRLKVPVHEICRTLKISKSTYYRYLRIGKQAIHDGKEIDDDAHIVVFEDEDDWEEWDE